MEDSPHIQPPPPSTTSQARTQPDAAGQALRAPRIIALMNQKGGVGKTTTAVNLAAAAAADGHRVLLVDMDPQSHATLHLGIDPQGLDRSAYTELLDTESDPSQALCEIGNGLWLLPAETDLAAAESELTHAPERHHRLSRILGHLAGRFDLVLIDCPPSLGLLTLNSLVAASEVLIPMQAHFLALQGVSKLFETVGLLTGSINPQLHILGVVLCMHDSQATHTQEVVADLEAFFDTQRGSGMPWENAVVFRPHIRRNIKLAESPSFGQSIFAYCPEAAGAKDYRALAAKLFASENTPPSKSDTTPVQKATEATPVPVVEVVSRSTPADSPVHPLQNTSHQSPAGQTG